MEHLRDILFNKVTSDNYVMGLHQLLAQAINNTHEMMIQRNALIDEFRRLGPGRSNEVLQLYLGLPRPDGPADDRYPSLINGLLVVINDVILFGKELAERLQGHARAAKRNYGRGAPKVGEVNFSKLDRLGLLPDRKEYEAVLTALRGEAVGSEPGAGTSVG
jgi:hypothetical protein